MHSAEVMTNSAPFGGADHLATHRTELPVRQMTELLSERDFSLRWLETEAPIRHFLLGFLSDRSVVDDCIQEVALLAWKKGPKDASPKQFLVFSLECAKRLAMAEIRKKYRRRKKLLAFETHVALAERVAEMEIRDPHGSGARVAALRSCLADLPPAPRKLLELRYGNAEPSALKDQSRRTGSSMDAIYKKLERLRGALKDCVTRKLKHELE